MWRSPKNSSWSYRQICHGDAALYGSWNKELASNFSVRDDVGGGVLIWTGFGSFAPLASTGRIGGGCGLNAAVKPTRRKAGQVLQQSALRQFRRRRTHCIQSNLPPARLRRHENCGAEANRNRRIVRELIRQGVPSLHGLIQKMTMVRTAAPPRVPLVPKQSHMKQAEPEQPATKAP